jgi:hypothetical protein
MRTGLFFSSVVLAAVLGQAAEPVRVRYDDNFMNAVKKPAAVQDWFTKEMAQKLAKSVVRTPEEAEKLALSAFIKKPGLDAREGWRATGLYLIGRDVAGFAAAGELVWEVRVARAGAGVSGLMWVSAKSKAVRLLFPTAP